MKYGLMVLILLSCFGIALSMMSDRLVLEFSGGILVAMDEQNQVVYVYDASGHMLEQKQLTSLQYPFLRTSWTTGNIQSAGLNTALRSRISMFSGVQASVDGRQLRVPYGNMTYLFGNYYQPTKTTTPAFPASVDTPQVLVSTGNVVVQSVIQPSGKAFISASEIRLKDGFNAKWGSEVRIVAQ